jgi:hypothetical protein
MASGRTASGSCLKSCLGKSCSTSRLARSARNGTTSMPSMKSANSGFGQFHLARTALDQWAINPPAPDLR